MNFNIYGAGLVGSLLSIFLAKKDYTITVYEKRPDFRIQNLYQGRSINLALSERGLRPLRKLGLDKEILKHSIPMYGRAIHSLDGNVSVQPYSKNPERFIHSISRKVLNEILITEAEANGVVFNFESPFNSNLLDENQTIHIGADGAFSHLREHINNCNHKEEKLSHSYMEIQIPARNGGFALDLPNNLHIWPRKNFMLIALPNPDFTFTATLFLSNSGENSFQGLTKIELIEFFKNQFPDVISLIPNLEFQLLNNPISSLATHYCENWVDDNKLLIGDAAHAIVPFYGQGMNCGFEDVDVLIDLMNSNDHLADIFNSYFLLRKVDADAIAALALYNFIEMRDKVSDPVFLERKKIHTHFHALDSNKWKPLYEMVTFEPIRYSEALKYGKQQDMILDRLLEKYSFDDLLNFKNLDLIESL